MKYFKAVALLINVFVANSFFFFVSTQTFSADNIEGFNGTSNPACIKDEVREPERNSNKLQDDHKSDASEQEDRERRS